MDRLKIDTSRHTPVGRPGGLSGRNSAEFKGAFEEAVGRVADLENRADSSVTDLLGGKADIHETMIGLQKLDISVRLLLTIRNKAVEAYKEIMNMQY